MRLSPTNGIESVVDAIEPTEAWLLAANARYRAADIPPKHRSARAWRDYALEHGVPLEIGHPIARRIVAWFEVRSTPSNMAVGPFFRGAFFWDSTFWSMDVPVIFGTVRINVFAMLTEMPPHLKLELSQDKRALDELVTCFVSATDCALSVDQLEGAISGFRRDFLLSGYRELSAASSVLLSTEPTGKATNSLTLAVEMFGKWLLSTRSGLDEKAAKNKYRHDVEAILRDCSQYLPQSEHSALAQLTRLLPPMEHRYKASDPEPRELWTCYLSAIEVIASLVRAETGRDTRSSLRRPKDAADT